MEKINKLPTCDDGFVLPFQIESSSLRGRLIRLDKALDDILHKHLYPVSVATLLGEAVAIAAALGSSLKYNGIFTLQVKSDGPVRLLVADVTSDGDVRACAKFDSERVNLEGTALLGKGYLVFTADQQTNNDRYQGVVNLEGESISEAVQHYFRQSEQIPTGIIAAANQNETGKWNAGCLLLQRMPNEGGIAVTTDMSKEDDWLRAMMFMRTCTHEELTSPSVDSEYLLFKLFNEEGVRAYDKKPLRHKCRCSQERVLSLIKSMPKAEIEYLTVNGKISVICEFCNAEYVFDKEIAD